MFAGMFIQMYAVRRLKRFSLIVIVLLGTAFKAFEKY